ncbi:hypothetical protein I4U23_028632 [Adineta vaga]|nr:hypothetical protein I4U23_028632 [Adineta vaga]
MSTIEKKNILSSPKHFIREHLDEKFDSDNIDRTNDNDEIAIEEVHTVNDWEHADLGDEQRKQKFLRLMGAKKHINENRTDIKDTHDDVLSSEKKHSRSKIENETINRDLEKQFNECLQSKILHTHHEGLGFHADETSTNTSNSNDECHQELKRKFIPATTQTTSSITCQEKH